MILRAKHPDLLRGILIDADCAQSLTLNKESVQSLSNLRMAFCGPLTLTSMPSRFRCYSSAAYHPFKHKKEVSNFLGRGNKNFFDEMHSHQDYLRYANLSMNEYMKMMKVILERGEVIKIQPNQFDTGLTFTFQIKQPAQDKQASFRAIVSCHPQGDTYLLTCF